MLLTAILSGRPAIRTLPEPQRQDMSQLADARGKFFCSAGCETGFGAAAAQLADDGQKLSIATKGMSMWFVVACVALPFAGAGGMFCYRWIVHGVCEWGLALCLALAPVVAVEVVSLVRWLNRRAGDGVVRAVLDRAARTLELRDYGVTLDERSIRDVILIRGWQRKRDREGSTGTWAVELSVIGVLPDGEAWRWHVITGHGRALEKFAAEASSALDTRLSR